MSTARKRTAKRCSAHPKKRTPIADPPAPSARWEASMPAGARNALNECVGAICLVEVTRHSLESKDLTSAEQEVLGRALKAIWSVHDWIYELSPDELDDEETDDEDEP